MFSIERKVAIITGAASGIGLATARRFAEAGARVVLADVREGNALSSEIGRDFVRTDVSREEEVEALMRRAAKDHGRIDVVINNAGIATDAKPLETASATDFERAFQVNTMSVVFGIKHAAPYMRDGGSIINTASYAGVQGVLTYGAYSASKSAIVGVTRTAALELATRRIRVNCVCPGTVDTPMAHQEGLEAELMLAPKITPLGRLCEPEEVAALFHFLASDEAAFISGQAICIDGAMTAGLGFGVLTPLLSAGA
jgi:NAD(P)-dependent dehydrogenase (short-subunit alcohol dehydrogenase family)